MVLCKAWFLFRRLDSKIKFPFLLFFASFSDVLELWVNKPKAILSRMSAIDKYARCWQKRHFCVDPRSIKKKGNYFICNKSLSKKYPKYFSYFLLFFRLGSGMGNRPWLTIILSLAVCFVCSAGMVLWQVNTDDEAMWTPYGSSVSINGLQHCKHIRHANIASIKSFQKL